jgi:hypothetical protein
MRARRAAGHLTAAEYVILAPGVSWQGTKDLAWMAWHCREGLRGVPCVRVMDGLAHRGGAVRDFIRHIHAYNKGRMLLISRQ